MAVVALCGAVIFKDDGKTSVMYQEKCERCGHVDNTRKNTPFNSSSNSSGVQIWTSRHTCKKCRYAQDIRIRH